VGEKNAKLRRRICIDLTGKHRLQLTQVDWRPFPCLPSSPGGLWCRRHAHPGAVYLRKC